MDKRLYDNQVVLRMKTTMKTQLQQVAQAEGFTVSELIRQCVRHTLAHVNYKGVSDD